MKNTRGPNLGRSTFFPTLRCQSRLFCPFRAVSRPADTIRRASATLEELGRCQEDFPHELYFTFSFAKSFRLSCLLFLLEENDNSTSFEPGTRLNPPFPRCPWRGHVGPDVRSAADVGDGFSKAYHDNWHHDFYNDHSRASEKGKTIIPDFAEYVQFGLL